MSLVEINKVSLTFPSLRGGNEYILKDFSLEIKQGEFTCLLGSSGCGKSSLLGLMAGFVKPSQGSVYVAGKKVSRPDISRTLVFQEYALFPWLNVIDNVAFGLEHKISNKQERLMLAIRYLQMVGLAKHAKSSISELSGGMKQRVALARALVVQPDLLLMDEPFAALDDTSRRSMQNELINIWQELKPSVVFVTHSVDEALLLADRIIVMTKSDANLAQSPGLIKADIRLDMPRPRQLSSMAAYREQILFALNDHEPQIGFDVGL